MKQQLMAEDLEELTESQRRRLNELWLPKPCEKAVTFICRNVEEDQFEVREFVIGGVSLSGTRVYLKDLRAMIVGTGDPTPSYDDEEPEEPEVKKTGGFLDKLFGQNDEEVEDGPEEGDPLPDGWDSMDFDAFPKDDCLPLPTIGQLIEYLQKLGYGEGSFTVGVGNEQEASWVDRRIPGSYGADYEEDEVCDALWSAVKELLK